MNNHTEYTVFHGIITPYDVIFQVFVQYWTLHKMCGSVSNLRLCGGAPIVEHVAKMAKIMSARAAANDCTFYYSSQ
jgi:hypothetical protein